MLRRMKPIFQTLPDALAFIEECLQSNDKDRLFNACLACRASETLRPVIIEELYTIHVKHLLRSLYLDHTPPVSFPENANTFKLGGHESESGHSHFDFKRTVEGWQLDSVWKCR